MRLLLELIVIMGIVVVFYSYVGYGIMLLLLSRITRKKNRPGYFPDSELPTATLIVAAFNEEDFIEDKIRNSLDLEYPGNQLKIIFISDGSTDRTGEMISRYPSILHLHEETRGGKMVAMDRAMLFVDTEYVIFSDANTLLNKDAIKNIMRHYRDERVGGVAGEKKILQAKGDTIAAGEGLYWKYESFLKKLDSEYFTVVGAAGELFSIRTALYEFPGSNIILDDFVLSLKVCMKGYRVVYEPEAYAMETASASLKEEQKRKIRISAGAFQSMFMLSGLLNPFQHGKLSFQYVSHRVLRWTLCPIFLPLIFLTNVALVQMNASPLYDLLLIAQCVFYAMAVLGWLLSMRKIKISLFYAAYYFIFINISLYLGFFRFLKGNQTVIWEKAGRKKYNKTNTAVY